MAQTSEDKLFTPDKKQIYTPEKVKTTGQAGRPPKKEGQKKSKKLILTLKPADYEEVKKYAEMKDLSTNEYIRVAIKFYIQHNDVIKNRY